MLDVIICANFGVEKVRGFGNTRGQILEFPIEMAGHPYNRAGATLATMHIFHCSRNFIVLPFILHSHWRQLLNLIFYVSGWAFCRIAHWGFFYLITGKVRPHKHLCQVHVSTANNIIIMDFHCHDTKIFFWYFACCPATKHIFHCSRNFIVLPFILLSRWSSFST